MNDYVMMSGNLGCVAYYFTKYLRKRGVNATLYLWKWEMHKDPRNPLKVDLELEDRLPDWIKFFPGNSYAIFEYWRASRKYDLIHAFNTDPIYAQFMGKAFISHPMGSDAREYALSKGFYPMMLRRAFRKNDAFFVSACDFYDTVIPRMKINNIINILPIHQFSSMENIDSSVPEREIADMLFFHPTSLLWEIKGNQRLIEAYARFVEVHKPSSLLILVEWGKDVDRTRALVDRLGIAEYVIFKKWMDKKNYLAYMKNSDIIFDQFIFPSTSTIQREANALGKPLIRYSDSNWFKLNTERPFFSAGTVNEIYKLLEEYLVDPQKFIRLGETGTEFIQKNNGWKPVTDKVIMAYEKIMEKRRK
jgi:glycosyltransferase involved in cell wall biosynthesis